MTRIATVNSTNQNTDGMRSVLPGDTTLKPNTMALATRVPDGHGDDDADKVGDTRKAPVVRIHAHLDVDHRAHGNHDDDQAEHPSRQSGPDR